MTEGWRTVGVVRLRDDGGRANGDDRAAAEEPLEVRLHGQPFAVIMRTPGHDRELAAGFLLAERVLQSPDDLGAIESCRDAAGEAVQNIVNVTVVGRSAGDVGRALGERRPVTTTASCGMCGRTSIESVTRGLAPVTSSLRVDARTMALLPDRLRAVQAVFAATGGLHAAGLFDRAGETVLAAEDVGRHNAVDKVVGAMMMRDALPLSAHVLFVSGRTSFEIVQKAFVAGIPIVGAVSAPSSLAIELAVSAGVTLVGFVRAGGFNIYSHPERIV